MLWGVVGLPVLLPIVALLQLLFPGLLRDQWRQYRYAVQVLLTQSTLIFLQWALVKWVFTRRPWWLSDDALAAALVAVAAWGIVRAWFNRRAAIASETESDGTHAVARAGPRRVHCPGHHVLGRARLGRICGLGGRFPLGSNGRRRRGGFGRVIAPGVSHAPCADRWPAASLEHRIGLRRGARDRGHSRRLVHPFGR